MIELYCHHCGQRMEIADQYTGQTGTCKNCGEKIAVPARPSKVKAPPSTARSATAIPYLWFAGTAIVVIVLALGIYMLVSADTSPPTAMPEVPSTEGFIKFPTDRVAGELRLRNVGEEYWGNHVADARGIYTKPSHQEVGVSVNERHLPDLSFLRNLAADDLSFLMLARSGIDDHQLKNIEHLSGLKSMQLGFTHITDEGLRSLGGFNQLGNLLLTGTNITDDGLAHLGGLMALTQLGLARTKVTHRGIRALSSLSNINGFRLSPTALTQEMVDSLKEFPNLGWLDIQTGFVPYRGFSVDPSLKLDRDVPTSPEAILLLRDLPQLKGLVLSGMLNDDSLIPALTQLWFLEDIVLNKTYVTPEGRDELKRALPKCTIRHTDPF